MKLERWVGLIHASKVFIGLANGKRIIEVFSEKAKNCFRGIQKHSLFFRGTCKIRNWFEAIRKRRNKAFWENLNRRWGKWIEAGIILIIALMPVLNVWEVLLGLTLLLYWVRFPESKTSGAGLLVLWLVLAVSSIMAVGAKGINRLATVSVWLLIAGLSGRTFAAEFTRRIIRFCLLSGLIWMIIGIRQQVAGIPTPVGWLEQGQNLVISVRSFSVFGNPNIYGLYLLSILVFGFLGVTSKTILYPSVAWPVLSLTLLSLIYSYSRTAWILGIGAVMVWFGKGLFRAKYILGWIGVLSLLLIIPGITARIMAIDFFNNTFQVRVDIWRDLLKILADYWLWGSGPGSFFEVFATYPTVRSLPLHGHQLYLELWLEHGIISLMVFVGVVVKRLAGFTGFPDLAKAIALAIILYLAAGFMETWWANKFCGGFFWLLIGLLESVRAGQGD